MACWVVELRLSWGWFGSWCLCGGIWLGSWVNFVGHFVESGAAGLTNLGAMHCWVNNFIFKGMTNFAFHFILFFLKKKYFLNI